MKKFQFSLQSVLDYRGDIEVNKATLFQEINHLLQIAQQDLIYLKKEIEKESTLILNADQLGVSELQQHCRYQTELINRQIEKEQQIKAFELKRQKAYQEWIQSKQDVQMMEKLKEKQIEGYQQELNRLECSQLDEFTVVRRG